MSRLVNVQSVFGVSDNRVQRPPFAEAAARGEKWCFNSLNPGSRSSILPCDDGQMWGGHAGAHEEDHVLVPGLPVVHHFLLEELQVVLVVPVNLEQTDGDLPVPPTLVHPTPAALAPAKHFSTRDPIGSDFSISVRILTFPMSSPRSSCSKGMSHSCRYTLVWLALRQMGPFHWFSLELGRSSRSSHSPSEPMLNRMSNLMSSPSSSSSSPSSFSSSYSSFSSSTSGSSSSASMSSSTSCQSTHFHLLLLNWITKVNNTQWLFS